jgi:uncharacterized protein
MWLFVILIIIEILTIAVFRQHLYTRSSLKYSVLMLFNVILSLWLWVLLFETVFYNSFYDNPGHIWLMLNLTGMVIAVVIPRVLLIILHYTGRLIRIKRGGYLKWLTTTGFIIMVLIISVSVEGTVYGRFNFKTEAVTVKIKGLKKDLDGLRIVQISDMHMTSFYHHRKVLQEVMDKVNSYKPDLLINTGDFVSFGWREFDGNDTILAKAKSRYGNYAILGNHDFGTYDPSFTEADKDNNVLIMNNLIKASGYRVLNDEYVKVKIGEARIGLIGIMTKGRFPHIIHGDLGKATEGLDSVDLKILLSHDPNQWAEAVDGKNDIDLTLSGHTHGMQFGIMMKRFKWSPAKYFYPHWSGLYSDGKQFHYVNRGLGCLAFPFRVWMPPEITILTLKPE